MGARPDASFDELVDQAERAPADQWDFSWLDGRADEDRPSWRYFDRVAERAADARRLLDVQCGTGRMLGDLPSLPPVAVGVDGWLPSIAAAAPRLRRRGATPVLTSNETGALPFASGTFDLVTSRHPVRVRWDEIARVLEPGGTYLAQHVGPHSMRELIERFTPGPVPATSERDPQVERRAAEAAGLVIREIRHERPPVAFYDIGAVVYFLRLVVWTVPGFRVADHRDALLALHEEIERDGAFRTSSSRVLFHAKKP